MRTNPSSLEAITEVCLYSRDLNKAESFYCDVLGLQLISSKDSHRFFRIENQVLLVFDPDKSKAQNQLPPHFASGNQHVAFLSNTENYAKWKSKISMAGIPIDQEITWPNNNLKSFYFQDPEGHILEILEGNIWI